MDANEYNTIKACAENPSSSPECEELLKEHAAGEYYKYYKSARACVEDVSSPECQELLKEGAEEALVAAGVDPEIAKGLVECAHSRDSDVCAKSSAKIAAVYGCTYATGGSGAAICSELAPILVDKLWPVIGPPLTETWNVALDLLDGVVGMLKGIGDALGGLLGFGGDDGPTVTEKMNTIRWKGNEIVKISMDAAIDAISKADYESKSAMTVERIGTAARKDGDVGGFDIHLERTPDLMTVTDAKDRAKSTMTDNLRRQPGFGKIIVLCLAIDKSESNVGTGGGYVFGNFRYKYVIVNPDTVILGVPILKTKNLMLVSEPMPNGWSVSNQEGWIPGGFKVMNWDNMKNFMQIRDAYGMILSERTRAIRDATFQSVGEMIARNIQFEEQKLVKPKLASTSIWPWLAALAGGGYLAYRYRKEIKKAIR